ncbi:hypothetical protein [Paraburkholderia phenoliruptrix]|uniref:hypothetical protein n=1 Tax=Paraburkholderia phenoliruptrix TaxID=252970 RepID=UPI002869B9D3|nr:hypothetical protein [Paraburkholderia phenoliruptrix]WMY10698.1 hypothetical protein P3F88_28815 [Paraburkholderia phenoliruptrix]
MATQPTSPNQHDQQPGNEPDETADPGGPPTDISKPVGDAIPTPVEPGLDQPLPEKGENPPSDESDKEAKREPLGETDTPPGVPPPGPSDFA